MINLKQITFINTFWNAVSTYTNQVLILVVSAILARLLTPEDFGIIAMIAAFSGFLLVYTDAGLGPAVIQFQNLNDHKISSLFWGSLGIGIILSVFFAVLAPFIAQFYNLPALTPVAITMSLGFILSSLAIIPSSIIKRNLQFKKIAGINITASLIASIIAIIMAFEGFGYWALVFKSLAGGLLSGILLIIWSKQKFFFYFRWQDLKDVWTYSTNILGFRTFNYWARNADSLLIGKFLGSVSLGFYNRAYSLMTFPIHMTTFVLHPVLHPIFANIQNNKKKVANSYYQVIFMIASISFPVMLFLSIMAEEVIYSIWGMQWGGSISAFKILAILGAIQTVVSTTGTIFLSQNRSDLLLKVGVINSIILVTGISFGLKGGIIGVAIGYSIAYLLIVIPTFYVICHFIFGDSVFKILSSLQKPVIVSICTSGMVYLVKISFKSMINDYVLLLLVMSVFFLIVYILTTYFLNKSFIHQITGLIIKK